MPLFNVEFNRLADSIGASALRLWLHTAAPTDADITNGRTSAGGGAYEAGLLIAAASISAAAGGDIAISTLADFGDATANVGTLTHWSLVRESDGAGVAWGVMPNDDSGNPHVVNQNDRVRITANTLRILGATI